MTLFDSTYRNIYRHLKTCGIPSRDTLVIPNYSLSWNLRTLPLLSLRHVNLQTLTTDLLWQLSGSSNVSDLDDKKFLWKEWADKNGFLESSYGRHFRKSPTYLTIIPNEKVANAHTDKPYFHKETFEIDQLRYVVYELRKQPLSRRAIVNIWNPANAVLANQPPCLVNLNFNLFETSSDTYEMHTFVNMRSSDFGLGFVFDIMHYAMLAKVIRENLNITLNVAEGGFLHFNSSNFHVYNNHLEAIESFINLPVVSTVEPTLKVEYYPDTLNGNLGNFLEPYSFNFSDYKPNDFVRLPKTIN